MEATSSKSPVGNSGEAADTGGHTGFSSTPAEDPTQAPKIGVRSTRQRKAVVTAMNEITRFSSAKDIHQVLVRRGDKVGLTTVYRTLQSLSEVRAVDVLHNEAGEALYRLCGNHHHHHLVCTVCGETVEIHGGPVEEWANDIASNHGFQLTGHTADVFGVCNECQGDE